ncbi:unnamed protein product, partial [Meganyctiphanes norvegica]
KLWCSTKTDGQNNHVSGHYRQCPDPLISTPIPAPATTTLAPPVSEECTTTDTNCGGHLTAESGTIIFPVQPGNYGNYENCVWTIETSGQSINITFDKFDVEVNMDYLEISEGLTNSGTSLGIFS